MSDRLAEIRERESKAAKGPWVLDGDESAVLVHGRPVVRNVVEGAMGFVCAPLIGAQGRKDGEFIAHARQDIPYLLAEVERLTGLVGRAYREGVKDGWGDLEPAVVDTWWLTSGARAALQGSTLPQDANEPPSGYPPIRTSGEGPEGR